MTESIDRLLAAIDERLASLAGPGERLDLYMIGRAALVRWYGASVSTRDIDVVVSGNPPLLLERAVEWFGKKSEQAARLGLYLETVPEALSSIPQGYPTRATEEAGDWVVIRLWCPEPNDLVISKLKRFHAGDREDIRMLCDGEESIDKDILKERFELAFWEYYKDDLMEKYTANLQRVLDYLDGKLDSV